MNDLSQKELTRAKKALLAAKLCWKIDFMKTVSPELITQFCMLPKLH